MDSAGKRKIVLKNESEKTIKSCQLKKVCARILYIPNGLFLSDISVLRYPQSACMVAKQNKYTQTHKRKHMAYHKIILWEPDGRDP